MEKAYCGADCSKCEAYMIWSKNQHVSFTETRPNCDGCRREKGVGTYYSEYMCDIKKCCIQRGLDNCSVCDEFPCAKLDVYEHCAPNALARD